jgi:hypothetical protein
MINRLMSENPAISSITWEANPKKVCDTGKEMLTCLWFRHL